MTDTNAQPATYVVLLYSDDPEIRHRMWLAVGTRPAPDMQIEFVEASTYADCVDLVRDYEIDLVVLDGEATPGGGIGIAKQLKDELDDAPPTCVVIARAADRWLAAYARVEATLMYPMDPVTTGQTIAGMLRERRPPSAGASTGQRGPAHTAA
jgi:DNA-binding response OmpR family regulator